MKTILISLIGRGNKDDGTKGYRKAVYKFDNGWEANETAFFGSALYKYLNDKHASYKSNSSIDGWIIFGTSTSAWSEIIEAVDREKQEKYLSIYDRIFDEENQGLNDGILKEWNDMLETTIPGIRLINVDARDYKAYINKLLDYIPEEDEYNIIFDMTHAYRHMSVLISFSLMYLKYLRKIREVDVYYGALDMTGRDRKTPVLKLDFISELFTLSTSFEAFNSSGYFPEVLSNMGLNDTESTYFRIEMNRSVQGELKKIVEKLDDIKQGEDYKSHTAKNIKSKIEPLTKLHYLDERMVERAKFFCSRNQYFKAVVLLYEAILILAARKYGIKNYSTYEAREHARSRMKHEIDYFEVNNKGGLIKEKWMGDTFLNLEYTRNSTSHGSQAESIQNYVEDFKAFKSLFQNALRMYECINN